MENHESVYALTIQAFQELTLIPVHFIGFEEVMTPFIFTIDLVQPSLSPLIDLAKAIGTAATFSIRKSGHHQADSWWHIEGIIEEISHSGSAEDWHHYQLRLVPKIKLLSLQRRTRVFRDLTLKDTINLILKESGITGAIWDLGGAAGKITTRPYVVQYDESDLAFITRLCARYGVWYFFTFGDTTALRFTDVSTTFPLIEGEIPYQPQSSGENTSTDWHRTEVVTAFSERRTVVASAVTVRGWKSAQPHEIPEAEQRSGEVANTALITYLHGAQVPERSGPGTQDVFAGQPDCTQVARQTVEHYAWKHRQSDGASDVRSLRAGTVLTIKDRGRQGTERWLVLAVEHHGAQSTGRGAGGDSARYYHNTFQVIPRSDKLPYRPEEPAWPKIPGLLTALVESTNGQADHYANLDAQGRYQVRLAMDRENPGDAKASLPVRMMSPSTGDRWGFHLPLHRGAEVLLSHVDGDPDRPVIAGAVSNTVTPQVVTHDNQTQSRWLTAGNNELTLDDLKGSEMVYLHAQKDRETVVENDETRKIGNNQTQWVGNGQTLLVGLPVPDIGQADAPNPLAGQESKVHSAAPPVSRFGHLEFVLLGSAKVVGGFYQIAVGGAMNTTVGLAKTEQVGAFHHSTVLGYRKIEVGEDFSVSVKGEHREIAEQDRKIETRKNLLIEAADEIVIKVGKAKITMKKNGEISIEGKELNIATSADTIIKAKNVKQN